MQVAFFVSARAGKGERARHFLFLSRRARRVPRLCPPYSLFPDLKHKIIEQISAGNKVVTRWEATGTHRAAFMGIAATRRKITLTGINIYTLTRGKLSASHVNWDMLSLMQQIGGVSQRLALPPKRAAK